MALITTLAVVFGVLAGIAALLWLSAVVESRQLGPVIVTVADQEPVPVATGQIAA